MTIGAPSPAVTWENNRRLFETKRKQLSTFHHNPLLSFPCLDLLKEDSVRKIAAVLALLLACVSAMPAAAQIIQQRDEIVLNLSAEGWVETKTARVLAVADVAIAAENRNAVRDRMMAALKQLSPNAEWRVSQFNRAQDAAGLERWRVTAEARLPENALGGLDERAKQQSQPGLQLRIQAIQFTPTLEEREAALANLRGQLYEEAKEEAARVAKLWPERNFRVARIDIGSPAYRTLPAPMAAQSFKTDAAGGAAEADAGDAVSVAQKLTLQATVTLSPEK